MSFPRFPRLGSALLKMGSVVTSAVLVITVGCLSPQSISPGVLDPAETEIKPLLTLQGRHSKIVREKCLRITSAQEWKSLWLEHTTGATTLKAVPEAMDTPGLDFENVMVIAVFEGAHSNKSLGAVSIGETAHRIDVRFAIEGRQQPGIFTTDLQIPISGKQPGKLEDQDSRPANSSDLLEQPWYIIVLPSSKKEVALYCDVRHMIQAPPEWEDWARFPAIAVKER